MMPMELPLRWNLRLLLRPPAEWSPIPSDAEWTEEGFSALLVGEMQAGTRGPPATSCPDAQGLSSVLDAMQSAASGGGGDASALPREKLSWLLSFFCAEPSDYAFDFVSGTIEAHADELGM